MWEPLGFSASFCILSKSLIITEPCLIAGDTPTNHRMGTESSACPAVCTMQIAHAIEQRLQLLDRLPRVRISAWLKKLREDVSAARPRQLVCLRPVQLRQAMPVDAGMWYGWPHMCFACCNRCAPTLCGSATGTATPGCC